MKEAIKLILILFPFLINAQNSNRKLSTTAILKNILTCQVDVQLGDKKNHCLENLVNIGCADYKMTMQEYSDGLSSISYEKPKWRDISIFLVFINDTLIYFSASLPDIGLPIFPNIKNSEKVEFSPTFCECWETPSSIYYRFKNQYFMFTTSPFHTNRLVVFNSNYFEELSKLHIPYRIMTFKEYVYFYLRTCGDNKIGKWYNEIFYANRCTP